jgi:hypothetical protein
MRLPVVLSLSLSLAGCGLIDSVSGPKDLSIQKFQASPEEVASGSSVTLSWEVEGADDVAIQGIGNVPPRGSRSFPAYASATYTLTARAGTSTATSSVTVTVRGSGGLPDPLPTPTPAPSPTPSPTPQPSPTPSPEPDPTPTPAPDGLCGTPAPTQVQGCSVGWEFPAALPEGQCIELNDVTVDKPCPVVGGFSRKVGFTITAKSTLEQLRWRSQASNKDEVTPQSGEVDGYGTTRVQLDDLVKSDALYIEVVGGGDKVRLRFRLKSKE